LQGALALLQRQVKNGLTHQSALAFLESGFADRVVASVLAAPWPEVRDRAGVRAVCRSNLAEVKAVLAAYPFHSLGSNSAWSPVGSRRGRHIGFQAGV
jgi:hypothetical protein